MIEKRDSVTIPMPKELYEEISAFLTKYPFVPFTSFTRTMVLEIISKPDTELVPFIRDKYLAIPREVKPLYRRNSETTQEIRERIKELTIIAQRYKPSNTVGFAKLARYAWRMIIAYPELKQGMLLKKFFPNQTRIITWRKQDEKPESTIVPNVRGTNLLNNIDISLISSPDAGQYIPIPPSSY